MLIEDNRVFLWALITSEGSGCGLMGLSEEETKAEDNPGRWRRRRFGGSGLREILLMAVLAVGKLEKH